MTSKRAVYREPDPPLPVEAVEALAHEVTRVAKAIRAEAARERAKGLRDVAYAPSYAKIAETIDAAASVVEGMGAFPLPAVLGLRAAEVLRRNFRAEREATGSADN